MNDDAAAQEVLQAGVVIIMIGALSLAYTVVLYAGAADCGPGATILPCSLPFWKATAIMSLFVGAMVMVGSIIATPANVAHVRAWIRRDRKAPSPVLAQAEPDDADA